MSREVISKQKRADNKTGKCRLTFLLSLTFLLTNFASAYGQHQAVLPRAIEFSKARSASDGEPTGTLNQCRQFDTGAYNFRREGEQIEIQIGDANCPAVSLQLRWSNGRNNGSNFHVTFLDSQQQAIYTKELSGFLSGNFAFPLAPVENQPLPGINSMMSVAAVPVTVVIETVRPFAAPANIFYTVTHNVAALPSPQASSGASNTRGVSTGKVERLKLDSEMPVNSAGKAVGP